ncbi:putative quinol monooxygenase [Armatimonas sp.]|uniref:putative quinol monooxygenase n=1 Tax=Armatimonas sp. TaxID=1872638 RepID=UPI003750436D
MYVVCVTVLIKPGKGEAFLEEARKNHEKTEADFKAHQQTAHYFAFRDAVEPLQQEPRKGIRYHSVYPETWS